MSAITFPSLWTPPTFGVRRTAPGRCPRCGKGKLSRWQRLGRLARSMLDPLALFATGGRLLDDQGKRILDAGGKRVLDDGAGNACCCGGPTCSTCHIGSWTLTFAGVTTPNGCFPNLVGSIRVTSSLNGTYTLLPVTPAFVASAYDANVPDRPCVWATRLTGSFTVYDTAADCTGHVFEDHPCPFGGWLILHYDGISWNVNAYLGTQGDGTNSFGGDGNPDVCECEVFDGVGTTQVGTVPLFIGVGGPVANINGGPGNCGSIDCTHSFTLTNYLIGQPFVIDPAFNCQPTVTCGTGGNRETFTGVNGTGGTVVCTPHP